jgi:hypothetical protein
VKKYPQIYDHYNFRKKELCLTKFKNNQSTFLKLTQISTGNLLGKTNELFGNFLANSSGITFVGFQASHRPSGSSDGQDIND